MRYSDKTLFPGLISGVFVLLSLFLGCGFQIGTGGTNFGESVPPGNIVYQGQFQSTGTASSSLSGTALIYLSSTGTYTLRLQTMTFTNISSGMQVSINFSSNAGNNEIKALQSQIQNQNYKLSITPAASPVFSNLSIISAQNPNIIYGTALLSAVTPPAGF